MAQNSRLKVLAVSGYHDLVTPFHVTEIDVARLGANHPNVRVHNYQGGHMTYLDDVSRPQMKADLAAFYRDALAN
jgi:carboxypeptidase C (cathepsin A)